MPCQCWAKPMKLPWPIDILSWVSCANGCITWRWSIKSVAQGCTLPFGTSSRPYRRKTFTERYEYPELPVPVKPRYRGFNTALTLRPALGATNASGHALSIAFTSKRSRTRLAKASELTGSKSTIQSACSALCALIPVPSIASSWAQLTTSAPSAAMGASSITPSSRWRLPGGRLPLTRLLLPGPS